MLVADAPPKQIPVIGDFVQPERQHTGRGGASSMVFRGQQLDDGMSLQQAGLSEGDKIYLITRTVGGF